MSKSTTKTNVYEGMTVQELEQIRRDLQSKLTCVSSDIGDWKISKCMEYQVAGLEAPYDVNELHTQRQAVRDEIAVVDEAIVVAKAAEENSAE